VESALQREESRGAHFRSDFPDTNPALGGMHQTVRLNGGIASRRFSSLSVTGLAHVAN
jgi:aspartate oxidase